MSKSIAYIRTDEAPSLPPPASHVGWRKWLWDNMFSSMANFGSIGASHQATRRCRRGPGWCLLAVH